jgi:hypothetical protein
MYDILHQIVPTDSDDYFGGAPKKKQLPLPIPLPNQITTNTDMPAAMSTTVSDTTQVLAKSIFRKRKTMVELSIDQSIGGIVSLAFLEKSGFNSVSTIRFNPGTITQLRDIPPSVVRIFAAHNHINTLDNFPEHVEHLVLTDNKLSGIIDLSNFSMLKYVDISDNHITGFSNHQSTLSADANSLPSTLYHLLASGNQIRRVNLSATPLLQTLDLWLNPSPLVIDAPDTIVAIKLPDTAQHKTSSTEKTADIEPPQKISQVAYKDALIDFYKQRGAYFDELAQYRKRGGSLPNCPGCGRAVGMHFSSLNQKHKALCGGSPPCNWNLTIHRGDFHPVRQVMQEMLQTLESTRNHIIRQKMDTLFEYISEEKSVELFEQHMSFYKSATELASKYTRLYESAYFDVNKANIIQQKLKKMQYLVAQTKEQIAIEQWAEVARIQVEEIAPIARFIYMLQYELNERIFDEDQTAWIIQSQVALSRTEVNVGETVSI